MNTEVTQRQWNHDTLENMVKKYNNYVSESAKGTQEITDYQSSISAKDVGLENVDNTSDADKPVSRQFREELDTKAALLSETNHVSRSPRVYDTLEAAVADTTLVRYQTVVVLGSESTPSSVFTVENVQGHTGIALDNGLYLIPTNSGLSSLKRVTAGKATYAEYYTWKDGTTTDEDHLGLLVTNNGEGITENDGSGVTFGVTVDTAAFISNYDPSYENDNTKVLVAFLGSVIAQDDGTCEVGSLGDIDYDNPGKLTASAMGGYKVLSRIDETHVTIALNVGAGLVNEQGMTARPIEFGGTGGNTASQARENLNIMSKIDAALRSTLSTKQDKLELPLKVNKGGTEGTDAATARSKLHVINARVYEGTCETAADVAAKVITCEEFSVANLIDGTYVNVTFTNTNSSSEPTLNINETGAKPIMFCGDQYVTWDEGATVMLMYIADHWECLNDTVRALGYVLNSKYNNLSWEEIDRISKIVQSKPEDYAGVLHKTKSVKLAEPINKSIVFEIVDICHTDWGSNHAFVWMPKEECLQAMAHQPSAATNKTYRDSQIRTALLSEGNLFNAFPEDLKAVWKDINYKYLTTATSSSWSASGIATTETAKLVLPSIVEVGLIGSTSGQDAEYGKEGTVFQAFAAAENADRIRKGNSSPVAWWLRSLVGWYSDHSNFADVYPNGSLNNYSGYNTAGHWVCPCFVV